MSTATSDELLVITRKLDAAYAARRPLPLGSSEWWFASGCIDGVYAELREWTSRVGER